MQQIVRDSVDLFWKPPNNLQKREAEKIKKDCNKLHTARRSSLSSDQNQTWAKCVLRLSLVFVCTFPSSFFSWFPCFLLHLIVVVVSHSLSIFSFIPDSERNICSRLSFCVVYLFFRLSCTHMSSFFLSSFVSPSRLQPSPISSRPCFEFVFSVSSFLVFFFSL